IVAVTGPGGRLLERYEYDDFGQVSIFNAVDDPLPSSSIGNSFLFTGHLWDPDVHWYYCRSRYLDPAAGRFTSRDRPGIWHDPGNLGNGYSYAHNNPHSLIDPSGDSTFRNIPCGGPWPGPRVVQIEYQGS